MILLRHGQSEFNLHFTRTRKDPGIIDPVLTPLGHEQAEAAADAIAALPDQIRRIVASPYTRALQTAAPLARRLGLPVSVETIVRERFAFTCDVGSPRTDLATRFPDHALNHLDDVWWPAETEPEAGVVSRAEKFRAAMAERDDWPHTVVVSHWGFILALTGLSVGNGEWLRCDPSDPAPEEIVWHP